MYADPARYITIRFPCNEAEALKAFADRTRNGNVSGTIQAAVKAFVTTGEDVKADKKVMEEA